MNAHSSVPPGGRLLLPGQRRSGVPASIAASPGFADTGYPPGRTRCPRQMKKPARTPARLPGRGSEARYACPAWPSSTRSIRVRAGAGREVCPQPPDPRLPVRAGGRWLIASRASASRTGQRGGAPPMARGIPSSCARSASQSRKAPQAVLSGSLPAWPHKYPPRPGRRRRAGFETRPWGALRGQGAPGSALAFVQRYCRPVPARAPAAGISVLADPFLLLSLW
jgi:hypothetical protein